MKKSTIITLFITIAVALLSIAYNLLGYLLIAILIICIAFLLFTGTIKLFNRNLRNNWLRIPIIIIIICTVGIVANSMKPIQPALPEKKLSLSSELDYIVTTDQDDRETISYTFLWTSGGTNSLQYRDSVRLARVLQLVAEGNVTIPQDEYNAALVLQHGHIPEHYELAHKLSTDAALHKVPSAEWLSQASWDRWQMSLGKPQKYGTQTHIAF